MASYWAPPFFHVHESTLCIPPVNLIHLPSRQTLCTIVRHILHMIPSVASPLLPPSTQRTEKRRETRSVTRKVLALPSPPPLPEHIKWPVTPH